MNVQLPLDQLVSVVFVTVVLAYLLLDGARWLADLLGDLVGRSVQFVLDRRERKRG